MTTLQVNSGSEEVQVNVAVFVSVLSSVTVLFGIAVCLYFNRHESAAVRRKSSTRKESRQNGETEESIYSEISSIRGASDRRSTRKVTSDSVNLEVSALDSGFCDDYSTLRTSQNSMSDDPPLNSSYDHFHTEDYDHILTEDYDVLSGPNTISMKSLPVDLDDEYSHIVIVREDSQKVKLRIVNSQIPDDKQEIVYVPTNSIQDSHRNTQLGTSSLNDPAYINFPQDYVNYPVVLSDENCCS